MKHLSGHIGNVGPIGHLKGRKTADRHSEIGRRNRKRREARSSVTAIDPEILKSESSASMAVTGYGVNVGQARHASRSSGEAGNQARSEMPCCPPSHGPSPADQLPSFASPSYSTGGQRGIERDFFRVDAENRLILSPETVPVLESRCMPAHLRCRPIHGYRRKSCLRLVEIHVQLRSGTEDIRAARRRAQYSICRERRSNSHRRRPCCHCRRSWT